MKIDSEKTIAHLKERLVETALNNIGYNEDVYLNIADHRIETWINEINPTEPDKGDSISRQAAIDEIEERKNANGYSNAALISELNRLEGYMMRLPSTQPEIVRCKDCKYYEHWYADKGRCFLWQEDGIGVFDNGYCNYGGKENE